MTKKEQKLPVQSSPEPNFPIRTEADKIWEEIKNLPIGMFNVPGQIVSMHVERLNLSPVMLHLKMKSPAVIVALENVLNHDRIGAFVHKFDVDLAENGYVTVKRHISEVEKAAKKK